MKKWIEEDWEFTVTVKNGAAKRCRLGLETGDEFLFQYATPCGFCPKTMPVLYALCEIARCGGSFRNRGSDSNLEIDFPCADGEILFHLQARRI